jgi:cellulose synthase operon protein C
MHRASSLPVALVGLLAGALLLASAGPAPAAAERPTRVEQPTHADLEMARLGEVLAEEIAEPRALLHLADLGRLLDEVTDLAGLRRILARTAVDRRAHPEVRAYARWLAARTEWRRGRIPRAEQWAKDGLGLFEDVWFVGPFDNEGGSGFDVVHPPETDELAGRLPDRKATFPGKDGEVSWRVLPDAFPLGYVDLGGLVDPDREVVVYLRAVIESERAQPAALRLGVPGPTRIWLNGEVVHTARGDHPARFDQYAVGVNLREGPNAILVKLSQRQGSLGYHLRLTDTTGGPLRAVRALSPDAAPAGTPARARPPQVDTVLAAIVEAAERAPEDPSRLADKARALALRHPFDRTDRRHLEAARAAVEAAGPAPAPSRGRARRADPERAARHHLVARFEDDHNRRRHALEAALEADPGHVGARYDLALHFLGRGDPRGALPHLQAVVSAVPGHVEAALSLAAVEAQLGFSEAERRRVADLGRAHARAPSVIDREAALAFDRGRPDRAADRLRVGVGLYPGDRGLRAALVSALLDLGRLDEAIETLEAGIRFEPASVFGRLQLADILSANGKPEAAERYYAEAAELLPDQADVHLRRASHHLRHGDRLEAAQWVERAFARRPQDPGIAELRTLLAETADDFATPFREDARALAEAARGEAPEGEDVWTLAEITAVQVHRSGLSTRVHQEVHKVLTPRGAERMRAHQVVYTPGDQILRIEQARVIKADGTILQARTEHERSLSEPWARLYFDQRARVIAFPEVAPGDVVELVWRREDVSRTNMFGDYFGDVAYFQGPQPVARRTYALVSPADRDLYFNTIALPGIDHRDERQEDGTRLRVWTATDVPKVVPEPGMPGWAEIAALLHVSTYETWEQVAAWWWRLIEEQLRPSPALVSLARDLVADIPQDDVPARVAAIHNYVVKQTRYVGLEFGIHGFKPYRVDQIHERRFGDCKDKAALIHTLLAAVGIDSQMVILRMRRLGRIPEFPASLAVFNHAILYVPQLDLWLDGTAEFAGTGELPTEDHDAAVLVVDHENPDRSWFGYVPVPSLDRNLSATDLSVRLSADGSAEASGQFEIHGSAAPSYRRAYQAEERRRQIYEQGWARTHPGVRVTDLSMDGLDDLEAPVRARFSLELPRFARADGDRLSFRPLGEGRSYTERYAPLSSRRHDLVLAHPFVTRHRIRLALPDGYAPSRLPDAESFDGDHGRFSIRYTKAGGELVVDVEVALSAARVEAGEYAAFRDFLGRVDRALRREIHLAPEAQARAP